MAAFEWIILLTLLFAYSSQQKLESSQASLPRYWNEKCHSIANPCKVLNSICKEGICACNPGYKINGDKTKCLKVLFGHYYEPCEEDEQCRKIFADLGKCLNNQCVCKDNYNYINGTCKLTKGFDESCTDDNECFAGSEYQASSCQNGRCRCNDGFYLRGKSACRRRMKKVGDECLLDQDCNFKNGTCVARRCVNNGKPLSEEKEKQITKEVGDIKVGDKCHSNDNCTSIGNSICYDGSCICDRLHFPTVDKAGCIPEIGAKCDPNKEELHVDHAVCRENRWTCKITKVATKDNRQCIGLADKINGTCHVNRECKLFVHGECKENQCGCQVPSDFNEKEKFCSRYQDTNQLGTYCVNDSHCKDSADSYCKDNKCICKDTFFEKDDQCLKGVNSTCQNNNDCLSQSQHHEECESDKQCLAVSPGTVCSSKRCECSESHYYKEGKCHPKKPLGYECTASEECIAGKTNCSDGLCKCLLGHLFDGRNCVPSLGSDCQNSKDCQIPFSKCQDNLCMCNQNYFEENRKCVKGLNNSCYNNEECRTEHSMCDKSDSTCKCKKNFIPNPDDKCVPISKYHGECEINGQCSTATPNSFCNVTAKVHLCECKNRYYFKDNECYPKKLVNEECTQSNECLTPNTDCIDKQCKCKEKYHLKNDKCYADRTVTEECTVSEECTTTNSHCDKGKCACLTPQYPNFHKDENRCSSAAINGPLFSIFIFVLLGLKVLL